MTMNMYQTVLGLLLLYCTKTYAEVTVAWDPNGYILYCPCMGRFGNQAEQFLGALRFAKNLNRTMVVPPWVAYDSRAGTSFTPYSAWFDFDGLNKFHRAIPMKTFMDELAPKYWPDDGKSRKIYCPAASTDRSPDKKSCPAKIGSPFGPFWDNFNIAFSGGSQVYNYNEVSGYDPQSWSKKYPAKDNPVIALMGAPGSFPIKKLDRGLQKYVKWSEQILILADNFIKKNLERPFIGIHLRNGMDWVRACEHIEGAAGHFMGSAQCCGYGGASTHKLTKDMCLPPKDVIVKKVQEIAKLHNASHVFIATDSDPMWKELERTSLKLVKYPEDYPVADLAILTLADAFIGNCVSTFTSFVVRHREVRDMPNHFFAFDHTHPKIVHDDL